MNTQPLFTKEEISSLLFLTMDELNAIILNQSIEPVPMFTRRDVRRISMRMKDYTNSEDAQNFRKDWKE